MAGDSVTRSAAVRRACGAANTLGIGPRVVGRWVALGLAAAALVAGPAGAQSLRGGANRRVVYLFRDALWSAEADGAGPRPLTRGMAVYAFDVAADGSRVAFAAGTWRGDRKRRELAENGVWVVNVDGTELRRLGGQTKTGAPGGRVGHLRWSPDGRSLAFDVVGERGAASGGGTLYVARLSDEKAQRAAPEPVASFSWTADGQITYQRAAPSSPPVRGPAAPGQPSADHTTASASRESITTVAPPVPPGAAPQAQSIPPAGAPGPGGAPGAARPAVPPAPAASGAGAE